MLMERRCFRCETIQPLENFAKDGSRDGKAHHSGYAYSCKSCMRVYAKQWRAKKLAANPYADKDYKLRKAYGIGYDAFQFMMKSQDHVCAICGDSKRLGVDHCHQSKRVRGLLCDSCNRALGLFKDNPQILANAIKYLHCN
jgi:hypothetical protein